MLLLNIITANIATDTILVFISNWNALEFMCWSAKKLKLFWAKNTKPGTAYCKNRSGPH